MTTLWTFWARDWNSSGKLPAKATTFAAEPLSDGRLQAWAVDTSGNIWVCSKSTTDPNSSWAPWSSDWNSNGPLPKAAAAFAAAPLSDNCLHAWAVDTEGTVWACFKSTTDPDSLWTPWTNDWNSNGALQATATAIAPAPLSDGRLELQVLRIPALYVMALWLKSADRSHDLLVPNDARA